MAMSEELANIFAQCEATKASDVHLACGEIPRFRMQGQLVPHPAFKRMDAEQVDAIAMELGVETLPIGCPDGTERVRTALLRDGSRLDGEFSSLKEIGVPAQLARFCDTPDGLVIVTGPTGSGKSTTLATLIDQINHTRQGHIITLEDPVEFRHASHRCLVNQRQIGRDARTFHGALVEAMRQDPDVILVGEMRDLATVRTALAASETGHLVFTTLHAGDCAGAVERLVALFPAEEQEGVRRQLALVLRGIFAQHLLPALQGGRVAACELLINTTAVANLIATGRTSHIYSAMETGSQIGMVALEQSLADLVAGGRIDEAAAMALTRSPDTLRRRLRLAKGGVNG